MAELETVEDKIKLDYNKLDAFIALHPKLSVVIAAVVFFLIGHFV